MRKLYRSSRDSKIFGVCGGLAEYFRLDATILRILTVIVAVFSGGSIILVYILAGFIIPKEPNFGSGLGADPYRGAGGWGGNWGGNWNGSGNGGGYNAWTPPGQGTQAPPPSGGTAGARGGFGGSAGTAEASAAASGAARSELDAMMEDIEKKALRQEIEDLKARLNRFEEQQSKEPKGE
ncbi:PspC domain-containing protein [Cohnella fermenti]|uniref:PspC domain-containing protein n=1 Tax=Cohnella fermenti TaxID=2565925 RepID=A0A4S4C584_9BACL|nr:PspC domain-containing protein [Cohnella fermenti]THF82752.1 PspC domain-containing protein [Cohnella fermenti]